MGILGAAQIADDGILDPVKVLGHELVAVAAPDRGHAEAFAAERGMAKVHGGPAFEESRCLRDPGLHHTHGVCGHRC